MDSVKRCRRGQGRLRGASVLHQGSDQAHSNGPLHHPGLPVRSPWRICLLVCLLKKKKKKCELMTMEGGFGKTEETRKQNSQDDKGKEEHRNRTETHFIGRHIGFVIV